MQVKMFTAGLTLILGCGGLTVLGKLQQNAAVQAARQTDAYTAEQLQLARELPSNPPDVAGAFVDFLAEGGSQAAQESCMMFDDSAALEFAADHHAPNCVTAMIKLQSEVSDPAAYANDLSVPETAWTAAGPTASLNGCALVWSGALSDSSSESAPGPLPGQWELTQLDGEGWQITQYQNC